MVFMIVFVLVDVLKNFKFKKKSKISRKNNIKQRDKNKID